jgi:hypothetical protein
MRMPPAEFIGNRHTREEAALAMPMRRPEDVPILFAKRCSGV